MHAAHRTAIGISATVLLAMAQIPTDPSSNIAYWFDLSGMHSVGNFFRQHGHALAPWVVPSVLCFVIFLCAWPLIYRYVKILLSKIRSVEPTQNFEFITLAEAAEEVFYKIKQNGGGSSVYGSDMTMEQWLKEISHFAMVTGIPIYGARNPGTQIHYISKDELKSVYPNLGATELLSIDGRSVVYSCLQVRKSDLRAFLPHLVSMTRAI